MSFRNLFAACALCIVSLTVAACSKSADNGAASVVPAGTQVAAAGHSHEGWWCAEHGVPEEVCAQCDKKLVAAFKAKGDWCDAHNRPESQCFICHPEKEATFAAQYEAKYGQLPPKPAAESGEADGAHEHHDET
jgi:hypothetical protein